MNASVQGEQEAPKGCLRRFRSFFECPPHILIRRDLSLNFNGRMTYQPWWITVIVVGLALFMAFIFLYEAKDFNKPQKIDQSLLPIHSMTKEEQSRLHSNNSYFHFNAEMRIKLKEPIANVTEFCNSVRFNPNITRMECGLFRNNQS